MKFPLAKLPKHLKSADIDLIVVQKILGHADIHTTMRYSHPIAEREKLAIEALANFSKSKPKKRCLSLVK